VKRMPLDEVSSRLKEMRHRAQTESVFHAQRAERDREPQRRAMSIAAEHDRNAEALRVAIAFIEGPAAVEKL
jgi:hypothetical protein